MLPGSLDTSFDGDGSRDLAISPEETAVLDDGRILVGGTRNGSLAVVSMASDGRRDLSFGHRPRWYMSASGLASVAIPNLRYFIGMKVQADGKILIAGHTFYSDGRQGYNRIAVARFTPSGLLDTTFGFGGVAYVEAWVPTAGLPDFEARLGGGALVVDHAGAVRALDDEGNIDPTYWWQGSVNPHSNSEIQPDGKLLVAGLDQSIAGGRVIRLNTDGTLDTTFDAAFSAGRRSLSNPMRSIALPDGRIVVFEGEALTRLLPDGTYDSTFGDGDGVAEVGPSGHHVRANLALQPDGKVLMVAPDSSGRWNVRRYDQAGHLDPSFSLRVGTLSVIGTSGMGFMVAQPDGRLLMLSGNRILRLQT